MAAGTSSINDTVNSIEFIVKGMASSIKSNERTITKLDNSVTKLQDTTQKLSNEVDDMEDVIDGLDSTTKKLSTDVDGWGNEVQNLVSIIKDQRDDIEALRHQIKAQSWRADSITTAEEAAKPAFQAICEEIIRLINRYTWNTSNSSFREEIWIVSATVVPSASLSSFLLFTREITHAEAQQIIAETKTRSGHLFRDPVTPARLMSLKHGLLRKTLSTPRCQGPKDLLLEFRSLIDFIRGGCEELARRAERKLMGDSDGFLAVVDKEIQMAEEKIYRNHRFDSYALSHDKGVYDWKHERSKIGMGGSCINGFRDLIPEYFPDPDNFRIIRDQLALVCKCEECSTLDA